MHVVSKAAQYELTMQPLRRFPDRRPCHPSVAATESSTHNRTRAYALPSIQETTTCMHARDPGRGFFVVALALIGPSNCSGRCCHAFCYSSFSSPGRKESQLRAEADTSRKPTKESFFIVNQGCRIFWQNEIVAFSLLFGN